MINGLYHAIIKAEHDVTNCVVVLNGDLGVLQGGDSITAFAGTFKIVGDDFTAELVTRKYADLGGYQPIFGPKPAKVSIVGKVIAPDRFVGTGTSPAAPNLRINVELRYLTF